MTETEEHIKVVEVNKLHCLRCGFEWFPRYQHKMPRTCANCCSPYWDTPRINKTRKPIDGKRVFPEAPCCRADQKEDNEK